MTDRATAVDEDFDADSDGYVTATDPGCLLSYELEDLDCEDLIAAINPGQEETCDGNDTNCDGQIDNGLDLDGDGFRTCDAPADCDDNEPTTYPGADELCDGVDSDCDGIDCP